MKESTNDILKRIQERREMLDNLKEGETVEFTMEDIAPIMHELKYVKLKHNKNVQS